MRKIRELILNEKDNIVREFYLGSTQVLIADNYCKDLTEEKKKKIHDRAAEIAVNGLRKQQ